MMIMANDNPILIVDSDPVLRAELIQTLARAGLCRAIAANSAVEAYRRLDDCQPRAAFVDAQLKGAGGLAAAFQLRARAHALGFELPVYLISAMGGGTLSAAASQAGAAGVIAWPADWASLAELASLIAG
jgi:DNA-binding NtrC family response regulator